MKDIEKLIQEVDGTMSIEGIPPTDEDKERIRSCLLDKDKYDKTIQELMSKHTVDSRLRPPFILKLKPGAEPIKAIDPEEKARKIARARMLMKKNTGEITMTEQIEKSYTYHAPKEGQPEKYGKIRDTAKALAYLLDELCPDSREKSLAFTKLDEVVMWANAAIARNE